MTSDLTNGFGNSRNSRIVYVDPNDLYGEVNGASLTPDYTDYCLWCNLIVEKGSRLKSGATGTDGSGTVTMGFTTKPQEGLQYMSFLQGAEPEKYNYLTTYYTDIDYSDIKQHNIVEGIGVESVSIAMTNYYVPEVTINFVDVRGSGFFSREEVTHSNGNLINLEKNANGVEMDNLYSCFTTMPYPRFKLQVKGFYGQPVTYQLSCSNFEGAFDNNTGNFRLTAKFIGHQYSILGDIPFQYIVAAPLCKFVGETYWNEHKDSNEWRLPNGQHPEKLYDVFNKIKSAIQGNDNKLREVCESPDQQALISTYTQELNTIQLLKNAIESFKDSLRNSFGRGNVVETPIKDDDGLASEQMLLFKNNASFQVNDDIASRYNDMISVLKTYVDYGNPDITLDTTPNGCKADVEWKSGTISSLTHLFNITNESVCIHDSNKTSSDVNFLDGYKVDALGFTADIVNTANVGKKPISNLLSVELSKNLDNYTIKEQKNEYCCIVDFNNLTSLLNKRGTELRNSIKEQENAINDTQKEGMVELIGFEPYIGSFFKVIMCHLETFVAMIYEVARNIYSDIDNNLRQPSMLGVNNIHEDTDLGESIVENSGKVLNIPPWPGLYSHDNNGDDSTNDTEGKKYSNPDEESQVWAWIGNFKGTTPWREQEFVEQFYFSLMKSIKTKSETVSSTNNSNDSMKLKYPVIPSDFLMICHYTLQNQEMVWQHILE